MEAGVSKEPINTSEPISRPFISPLVAWPKQLRKHERRRHAQIKKVGKNLVGSGFPSYDDILLSSDISPVSPQPGSIPLSVILL
jgi:hypothetical protein